MTQERMEDNIPYDQHPFVVEGYTRMNWIVPDELRGTAVLMPGNGLLYLGEIGQVAGGEQDGGTVAQFLIVDFTRVELKGLLGLRDPKHNQLVSDLTRHKWDILDTQDPEVQIILKPIDRE